MAQGLILHILIVSLGDNFVFVFKIIPLLDFLIECNVKFDGIVSVLVIASDISRKTEHFEFVSNF